MNRIITLGLGIKNKLVCLGYGGSCHSGGEKISFKFKMEKIKRFKSRIWK